jgi:hypothetical protein
VLQSGQTPGLIFHLMSPLAALGIYLRSARPFLLGFSLPAHASRFSLRFPQWESFRSGLNVLTTLRFNALMMPIRANIVGPPNVTTRTRRVRLRPWHCSPLIFVAIKNRAAFRCPHPLVLTLLRSLPERRDREPQWITAER